MDLLEMAEAGGKRRISKWTKPVTSPSQYIMGTLLITHKIQEVLSVQLHTHSGVQNFQQDFTQLSQREGRAASPLQTTNKRRKA